MDAERSIADSATVNRTCSSLLALLTCICACLRPNPAFDPDAGDDAGPGLTTVVSAGESTAASSAPATGETSSGSSTSGVAPTSSGVAPTSTGVGTSTSGMATTGEPVTSGPDSTSSSGSTGGPSVAPGTYEVPASLGTCVFAAVRKVPIHGGPDQCSVDADTINNSELIGLMMIDVQVDNAAGMSRPARPYLRFDVPDEFAGLTVVSATLHVQVADNVTDLPQSGELWWSEPFDAQLLKTTAPKLVSLIAPDKGEVQPDEWLTWSLDPGQVMAGQPLFFGLLPTHNKGVILRGGTTTPGFPYLEVELQ
jgi:hypothetical protein